jgi:hypothetical protein
MGVVSEEDGGSEVEVNGKSVMSMVVVVCLLGVLGVVVSVVELRLGLGCPMEYPFPSSLRFLFVLGKEPFVVSVEVALCVL